MYMYEYLLPYIDMAISHFLYFLATTQQKVCFTTLFPVPLEALHPARQGDT